MIDMIDLLDKGGWLQCKEAKGKGDFAQMCYFCYNNFVQYYEIVWNGTVDNYVVEWLSWLMER